MRIRKPKTVTVRRGQLQGQGTTKVEARANLDARIDWALEFRSAFIECRYEFTIVIIPTPSGWESRLLPCLKHGQDATACTCYGQEERAVVIERARLNAAMAAWRAMFDDADHVAASGLTKPAELERWIQFQRRYLECKAKGMSNGDAYAHASGDPRVAKQEAK